MLISIKIIVVVACLEATWGFLLENGPRNVTKILKVGNGGRFGQWTSPEFCPEGTFASGFTIRLESNQFTGDDTALNAIRLTCTDGSGHAQLGYQISSGESPYGKWLNTESCIQQYHESKYLVGFALQVESAQGGGDDTAANFVKFFCRDFEGTESETELNPAPGRGPFGDWGEWSETCDDYSAICGMITKIESPQQSGDDTALNDVIFYCCSNDSHGPPVGK